MKKGVDIHINKYIFWGYVVDMFHFFVVIYLWGGFFVSLGFMMKFFHALTVLVTILSNIVYRCPLTFLRGWLWDKGGRNRNEAYRPFIDYYIKKITGITLPRNLMWVSFAIMGVFVLWRFLV